MEGGREKRREGRKEEGREGEKEEGREGGKDGRKNNIVIGGCDRHKRKKKRTKKKKTTNIKNVRKILVCVNVCMCVYMYV